MLPKMQNYNKDLPFVFRHVSIRSEDGIESQLMVTSSPFGYRRMAEMIRTESQTPCAAILYVHWYEPEAPDSNRSQFVAQATEMAKRGAACLLVETMWSDLDFFLKRTQKDDPQNSIRQVVTSAARWIFYWDNLILILSALRMWDMTSAACTGCWPAAWTNVQLTTSSWQLHLDSRTGICMLQN